MAKTKVAVIGAGISGLSAAYFLKDDFDVVLYEQHAKPGGHAHTVEVTEGGRTVPVDVGFIVLNYQTYPYLTDLFEKLQVPLEKSSMSFGVSVADSSLEYGSSSLVSLFAQKRNLFRASHWRMIWDILKFNRSAIKALKSKKVPTRTLAEFVEALGLSESFKRFYLFPMGAAIWSMPFEKMLDFPAQAFLQFFYNHGLLQVRKPIQWYTVKGGSQVYVARIIEQLNRSDVEFAPKALGIDRGESGISIEDVHGRKMQFDKVVIATHSDQALNLLNKPSQEEKSTLEAIQYKPNRIVLHQDASFMPKEKKAWSSWVYLSEKLIGDAQGVSLTYWMNNLQPLPTKQSYFVTVNPAKMPATDKLIGTFEFAHPQFDQAAINAQGIMPTIQGKQNTYFCGAYLRYGFHEDGIWSAVQVVKQLQSELKNAS